MQESEFIKNLEKKAGEQKKLVESEMMPNWAKGVGEWLVVNPWRLIIPVASITYLALRMTGGERVREIALAIFGGY